MALSFFATCPKGLESLLLDEIKELGALSAKETVAGVSFKGDFNFGLKVCLWSRFASRVLLELVEFYCETDSELYIGANGVAWERYFDKDATISVSFTGTNDYIRNTQYGALKVKDGICDRFQTTQGGRPDVDKENPDVVVRCHLKKGSANILLDLSGNASFKREFHRGTGIAPLKENLAAAMVKRSGFKEGNFLDPMCGSGSLLLEAALMATDCAPGIQKTHYGFYSLKQFDNEYWQSLLNEARARKEAGIKKCLENGYKLIGFDADPYIVNIANQNAQKAGFGDLIEVIEGRVEDLYNPFDNQELPVTIVTNPPYGERMGNFNELISLYTAIGQSFKRCFKEATAAVISTSQELLSCLRLRADKVYKLYNGKLLCQLRVFKIKQQELQTEFDVKPEIAKDFANRLKKNLTFINKWAKHANTNAYRVYDADIPEYAAAIDYYAGYYVIQAYKAPQKVDPYKAKRHELDMLAATVEVTGVEGEKVILKSREVQKGTQQYEKSEEQKNEFITVNEDNALYRVNLHDYLDTGLFLDSRIIRQMIKEKAQDKEVLNLFAYTCSASTAAALGGAKSTVSVDMSKTYLNWGIENFKLNHINTEKHEFIQADCLAYLSKDQGRKYDLIYIDPPTFSNSKRMETSFDVKRDQVALLSNLTRHLKNGGEVIFCTNLRGFKLDYEGLLEYGFEIEDISKQTLPRDFARNEKIHSCFRLIFDEAKMTAEVKPIVETKSTPRWQKTLNQRQDVYHDYTQDNSKQLQAQMVWGDKAQKSSTRTSSFKKRDSNDKKPFDKSKRSFNDKKSFNKDNRRAKPRVFGPQGLVKD